MKIVFIMGYVLICAILDVLLLSLVSELKSILVCLVAEVVGLVILVFGNFEW